VPKAANKRSRMRSGAAIRSSAWAPGMRSPSRSTHSDALALIATARAKLPNGQLSDMSRTVSALVKYMPPGYPTPIHILRWYDTAWSN